MDRITVSSSMISSIGYNNQSQVLEIEFNDKSVYQYYSVPFRVYDDLMKAPSHGKFFHRRIKDKFPYKKIIKR